MQSKSTSGLSADALDFAPDLLSIQEHPPARLPRVLLLTVAALCAATLAWACWAQLDIVASAEGRLVPLSFTKVVQPAEAGVVTDILVAEGEVVRQGQLLMRLDARVSQADSAALGRDVALKRLTLRRIDAELADRPFSAVGDGHDASALMQAQVEAQFRARRQSYLDGMAQESEALNRARSDLRSAEQVQDKLARTLPSYRQSAAAYGELVKQGFVGELAFNEKSREAIEKEQDLSAQAANVQSLHAAIAQAQRRIDSLRSQYRSQLENERIETIALLNRSEQELEKSRLKLGLTEIRAPNAGVVKDLATTTRGAVVAAGALLMNIVPREEPLQAEVLLRNEDVGFVAPGQKAVLKVAAYPFQKYGLLDGEVALLSADAADPKLAPAGQPPTLSYRAIVRLKSHRLMSHATGESLALSPGMLVIAEIHQGERSVFDYLLSPMKKLAQEAARER
jgi:hemolysin D